MKKNNGFTLIEIILVIIFTTILISISVPKFSKTYKLSSFRQKVAFFEEQLKLANILAIVNNKQITLIINEDNKSISFQGYTKNNKANLYFKDPIILSSEQRNIDFTKDGEVTPFKISFNNNVHEIIIQCDGEIDTLNKDEICL